MNHDTYFFIVLFFDVYVCVPVSFWPLSVQIPVFFPLTEHGASSLIWQWLWVISVLEKSNDVSWTSIQIFGNICLRIFTLMQNSGFHIRTLHLNQKLDTSMQGELGPLRTSTLDLWVEAVWVVFFNPTHKSWSFSKDWNIVGLYWFSVY